jgi:hypothetical protein
VPILVGVSLLVVGDWMDKNFTELQGVSSIRIFEGALDQDLTRNTSFISNTTYRVGFRNRTN